MMNAVSKYLYERSFGLLLLRVRVGLVFFMHVLSKVQDLAMTTGFFAHTGLPAWVAVAVEDGVPPLRRLCLRRVEDCPKRT